MCELVQLSVRRTAISADFVDSRQTVWFCCLSSFITHVHNYFMDSFNSPDEKMTLNDKGFTVCEGNQAGICAPLNLPTVQACLPGPSCFSVLIQTVVTRAKVFTFIQTGFKWVSRTEQINSVHLCTTLRKPLKVWCVQRESESITFIFSVPKWHFGVQLGFLCANIIRQFQGRMHAEYWRIFIVLHFPCKKKQNTKHKHYLSLFQQRESDWSPFSSHTLYWAALKLFWILAVRFMLPHIRLCVYLCLNSERSEM